MAWWKRKTLSEMNALTDAYARAEAAEDTCGMIDALIEIACEYDRRDATRGVRHAIDAATILAAESENESYILRVEKIDAELDGGAARA